MRSGSNDRADQALGRSGQKTGEVYKVSFPKTDLHLSVRGLATKPGLALGSWAAFLGTMGHSPAEQLAASLRAALSVSKMPLGSPPRPRRKQLRQSG